MSGSRRDVFCFLTCSLQRSSTTCSVLVSVRELLRVLHCTTTFNCRVLEFEIAYFLCIDWAEIGCP